MTSSANDRSAASNPSTSLEALDELAGPWPEEVATNAAVLKQSLDALELRTIWAMCSSPTVVKELDYDQLIDRLNGHDDFVSRAVRFAFLANVARPKATRSQNVHGLTDDDLLMFRDVLTVRPEPDSHLSDVVGALLAGKEVLLDAEALRRQTTDADPRVRRLLLENSSLTAAQRGPLENDPDAGVRRQWATSARTEAEMLRAIDALDEDQLGEFLFDNPWAHLSTAVVVNIAKRGNADTNHAMKEFVDLPAEAWRVMLYG